MEGGAGHIVLSFTRAFVLRSMVELRCIHTPIAFVNWHIDQDATSLIGILETHFGLAFPPLNRLFFLLKKKYKCKT